MSLPIFCTPNKREKILINHFHLTKGYSRSTAKKHATVLGQLYTYGVRNPDGFYKYKQECRGNPLYRQGDSWEECLDMSKSTFNPIFDEYVNRHKSKTAYRNSTDKFAGKFFCSYMECGKGVNKTYYIMNKELVKEFFDSLMAKLTEVPSTDNSKIKDSGAVNCPPKALPFKSLGVVENPSPLACAHPKSSVLQTITSLSGGDPAPIVDAEREKEKLVSKKMLELWNNHMQDQVVWRAYHAPLLCKTLNQFFKGCLEAFKRYCLTVASSDYLTGKAKNSNFKACLFWAIKPEKILEILEGAYGVKNFFTLSTPEESELKAEIKQLDSKIKVVECGIKSSQQKVVDDQNKKIDELVKSLTDDERSSLREESDKDFYHKNPKQQQVNDGFSRIMLNAHFEGRNGFLQRKLKERLGIADEIVMPLDLIAKKEALIEDKEKKSKELNELHRKIRDLKDMTHAFV